MESIRYYRDDKAFQKENDFKSDSILKLEETRVFMPDAYDGRNSILDYEADPSKKEIDIAKYLINWRDSSRWAKGNINKKSL